jgi:DNA-binding MarR family transcriptional regulator
MNKGIMSTTQNSKQTLIDAISGASQQFSTSTVLFHTALADRLGLNPTDHKCVDVLLQRGSMTAGQLAEVTGLTTGSITTALDRLEKAGFIRRAADPHDRRKVILEVIPDSLTVMFPLFDGLVTAYTQMLDTYSEAELGLILEFIHKTVQITDEQAEHLRSQGKK